MEYTYKDQVLTSQEIMNIFGYPGFKLQSAKRNKYNYELKFTDEEGDTCFGYLALSLVDKYLDERKKKVKK